MNLLEVEEAQQRIWQAMQLTRIEWVNLNQAHGRILAQDIAALRQQPPLAMSAMDGYAVRAANTDLKQKLRVIGEVPAGRLFEGSLEDGQAIRIFTGAVLPDGADAILIQENATRSGDWLEPHQSVKPGEFVRPQGLDFVKGWIGLKSAMRLDARAIGLAASMGHGFLPVRCRPRVAVIATGDELCLPGTIPSGGQIVSSNTPALMAMIQAWGGDAVDIGIAKDEPQKLLAALEQARYADLVVTTGGASVGDFDLVQSVAGQAGMALDFWKIRMRPGKPLIFGQLFDRPFLGLPGNPVSAAVCALIFLRGALATMLDQSTDIPRRKAILGEPLEANGDRRDFARGWFIDCNLELPTVRAAGKQDSSMFATFAHADVLIDRPILDKFKDKGETIEIIDLQQVFRAIS